MDEASFHCSSKCESYSDLRNDIFRIETIQKDELDPLKWTNILNFLEEVEEEEDDDFQVICRILPI